MGKLPKIFIVLSAIIFVFHCSVLAYDNTVIENTADNPRLVNLAPEQYRALDTVEKRIYNNSFAFENTMDRIERLEMDLFQEIQSGTPAQRVNALRLESTKVALRGTPMTPMMDDTFNKKYINPRDLGSYYDDVGIIDGLIRAWWPDFYATLSEYRKYKEANFY